MIFFFTRSVLALYGRPSIIFCEYLSPMPGSAVSWSLVAVLMSSGAAVVDVMACGAGEAIMPSECDAARDVPRPRVPSTTRAQVRSAPMQIERLRFIFSQLL